MNLWLCCAGFALAGITATILGPVLPSLQTRFQWTDAEIGRFFLAQFLGSLAGAVASGPVASRFGVSRTAGVAFLVMALGFSGLALPQAAGAFASMLLCGISIGLAVPAINLLVAATFPLRRVQAINLLNLSWTVGAVASGPIGFAVARPGAEWIRIFSPVSAALLLVALVLFRARSVEPAPPQSESAAAPARIPSELALVAWSAAFAFLYVGFENGLAGWLPSYARRIAQLSPIAIAVLQSVFWTGLILGRLSAAWMLRYLRPSRMILAGVLVALAGGSWLQAASNLPSLFAAAFLTGASLATVFPNQIALFTESAGSRATVLAGRMFAGAALGGASIPWLIGEISSQGAGLRAAPLILAVCALGMAAIEIVLERRRAAVARAFLAPPATDSMSARAS